MATTNYGIAKSIKQMKRIKKNKIRRLKKIKSQQKKVCSEYLQSIKDKYQLDQKIELSSNFAITAGVCDIGGRTYQEDEMGSIILDNKLQICFLADGHGGKEASDIIKRDFINLLLSKIDLLKITDREYIQHICQTTIDELHEKISDTSGTTFVFSICFSDGRVLIGNVGDSRAYIFKDNLIKFITTDHDPANPIEKERVEARGGFVSVHDCARVNGSLAVSRYIGDKCFQPDHECDFTWFESKEVDIILLVSDGVSDYFRSINSGEKRKELYNEGKRVTIPMLYEILEPLGNDEIRKIVSKWILAYGYNKQTVKSITEELVHRSKAYPDNLTAIATILKHK
jgi:serine/threonine protein phosphatase PrpC